MSGNFPMNRQAKALLRVRGLLEKGWCQGSEKKIAGDMTLYCLIGAVYASSKSESIRQACVSTISQAVPSRYRWGSGADAPGLVEYNDTDDRKKSQVLSVVDKAILSSISKKAVHVG